MYKKSNTKWLKHYDFILLDIISCLVSFVLAYYTYFYNFRDLPLDLYRTTIFVTFLIDIVVIFFQEPFSGILERGYLKELKVTLIHVTEVVLMILAYMFITKLSSIHSRITISLFVAYYFIISYITRILRKKQLKALFSKSTKQSDVSLLILVEKEMIDSVKNDIINKNYNNYNVIGLCVLDDDKHKTEYDGIPVVCDVNNISEYVCKEWVDEVLFISKNSIAYKKIIEDFVVMGITQHIKINVVEELSSTVNFVEKIGSYTCLTSSIKTANNTQLFLKRMLDIVGGFIGCLITIVLMIIFYPIVQIKSPGPLIYTSERIGKNGKRFKFYKFRSMVTNADDLKKDLEKDNIMSNGMMFKVENDPRIIKGYGEFIRKTSLDEFPQFFNVLKGDMSLVGTRPPTPDEWENYKFHHRVRLSVKPGITGMWQASGRNEIKDFEEVVKLDSYYAHNWSLGLDIKLLLKTIALVISRKGSM